MEANPINKKFYLSVLALIMLTMLLSAMIFLKVIEQSLLFEAENSLSELAQQCSIAVENKISGKLDVLSTLANLEGMRDSTLSNDEKLKLIRREVSRSKFLRIGISDLNGNAHTTDNKQVYIGDRSYFMTTLGGAATVSSNLHDRAGDFNDIVVYCTPIKDNADNVIAAVFATDYTEHLSSLIYNVYAGANKEALLISSDGTIIATNTAESLDTNSPPNFLERIKPYTAPPKYAHIQTLLQTNSVGAGTYNLNHTQKIIGISTINNKKDWNIAVIAPQDFVMMQTRKIMDMVAILIAVLMFFVTSAFIYFYILNKKYNEEKITARVNAEKLKMKDDFIANVSHEIRTPMNAITGMAYFLKSTNLTAQQKNYLDKAESAIQVLQGIINDILDAAKISSGKLRLRMEPFLLSEVITTIDNIFATQIENKGLLWNIRAESVEKFYLIGDKQRLTQIIINFVNNAYKFTEQGEITLDIKPLSEDEDSICYLFSIHDTGIGIAKANIQKLFIPFEQLEDSLNKVYEGTGLGLSICKSLIQSMNGELEIRSENGQGSTFSFSLTFRKTKDTALQVHQIAKNRSAPDNARVLLVEDSEINAEIAGMLLSEINVSYDWADNGLKAIEFCRNMPTDYYQLVLMDIHMPQLNGYDAAHKLRNDLHISAKILALTATTFDEESFKNNHHYMDGYLLKPFHAEQFKQTILDYIGSNK